MTRAFLLGVTLATVFWLLLWALVPLGNPAAPCPLHLPTTTAHCDCASMCPVSPPDSAGEPMPSPLSTVGGTSIAQDASLVAIEDIPAPVPEHLAGPIKSTIATFIRAVNASGSAQRHRSFAAVWRSTVTQLDALRIAAVREQLPTRRAGDACFEFLRVREVPGDDIFSVPCVPMSLPGLMAAELVPFGVVATFEHKARNAVGVVSGGGTTAPRNDDGVELRVAVEMSGHMRTYDKCGESLREHLLKPNGALLFGATYPDLGNKEFGKRVQEVDDSVRLDVLRDLYGADHLAALYLVDLPTARRELSKAFPTLFILRQWSWMIYQLFMMELAHNMTEAHVGLVDARSAHGSYARLQRRVVVSVAEERIRTSWGAFDVYVRVRPDLYILGTVRLTRDPLPQGGAVWFHYRCGDADYKPVLVNTSTVLRSTHHPVWLWAKDPLSDHSAVGLPRSMGAFLRLFSDTIRYAPQSQEKRVFYHGQTAEKLWGEHATRQGLTVSKVPGWHLMLRKPGKFTNGTLSASPFKKKLISLVFGATDVKGIACAANDNSNVMLTHPPTPRKKKVK